MKAGWNRICVRGISWSGLAMLLLACNCVAHPHVQNGRVEGGHFKLNRLLAYVDLVVKGADGEDGWDCRQLLVLIDAAAGQLASPSEGTLPSPRCGPIHYKLIASAETIEQARTATIWWVSDTQPVTARFEVVQWNEAAMTWVRSSSLGS